MIFLLALIPATMLTVAGYVVLYVAHRSEGGLRGFGRYLAFWAFTLAALVVLGSFLAAAHGGGVRGCMMCSCMMHGGVKGAGPRQCPVMRPWRHEMPGAVTIIPGAPPQPAPEPSPPK